MWGFKFINMIEEEMPVEFLPLYFNQYKNPMVAGIIKKMRYFLGMGLGRKHQGIVEPVHIATQRYNYGLGYKTIEKELKESERKNKDERKPYKKTLSGYL